MGYACPVCADPQSDGGHLANHLAFTAMLRGGEHEAWLDEHAPEWTDLNEETLAERIVPHAECVEFPQVFEDTTASGTDGDDRDAHRRGSDLPPGANALADEELDEAAREAIAEARELTRRRREDEAGDADDGTTETETETE